MFSYFVLGFIFGAFLAVLISICHFFLEKARYYRSLRRKIIEVNNNADNS